MYEKEKDKVSRQQDFMRVGIRGYHGDGFVTELFPFSFNSIFVPLGEKLSLLVHVDISAKGNRAAIL
jgi:hypothetical protein